MAATGATRHNRTTRTADRNRLPLTPKVTATRRGVHQSAGRAQRAESPAPTGATPAMHITPNVTIAGRGDVRSARRARGQRSILRANAIDLRRFAV